MPAQETSSREGRTPATASATIPLFPLGPWLWSSLAAVFWSMLLVSGVGLLFFYQPSIDSARSSLVELREASGFDFLRSLHYWASHGLLIAVWIHLMRVFVVGSYRRVLGWTSTVLLTAIVIAEAWTGTLLPAAGGRLADSLTALYVFHILLLPLATVALLRLWRIRRSPEPAEDDHR